MGDCVHQGGGLGVEPIYDGKYYDHILRGADSAERVAWYIWMNPVRQGLCRTPGDYPWLGSFTAVGRNMLRATPAADWTPPWKAGTGTD